MCDHLPMIACVQNPLYSRKIREGDLSPIFPEGGGGVLYAAYLVKTCASSPVTRVSPSPPQNTKRLRRRGQLQ